MLARFRSGLVIVLAVLPAIARADEPAPPRQALVGNAAGEPVYLATNRSPVKLAGQTPTKDEAKRALQLAVQFFRTKVGRDGGYLWQYGGDLALREAEGRVADARVWVQPPGTPTVGEAFLDAYEATGEAEYLGAAKEAAAVLLKGQMRTGGWGYAIELDPAKRTQFGYRDVPAGKFPRWNKATVLDDDTTTAAVRFLARFDKASGFKDKGVREAVEYAAAKLIAAQYPNGSWFGWWENDPRPASEKDFPVKKASFPETWAWKVTDLKERWPAKYVVNDDLMSDQIGTWLALHDVYRDDRYLATAKKAGGFLLLAQLPDPQPAWAQQYDLAMQPCWGRKFEPPAVTGAESQTILETLLLLHRRTGDLKFLEPIPPVLAYLKKSALPNGRLARFYELKTNRPLYFDKDYNLTHSKADVPTHYGFEWESRVPRIEAEFNRVKTPPASELNRPVPTPTDGLAAKAAAIIRGLDDRGAWAEKGSLRFHNVTPKSGIIRCQTFADNVATLTRFIKE